MITIFEYPKYNNIIKCNICGCEFSFEPSDIKVEYTKMDDYIVDTKHTVLCPICSIPHKVTFIKEKNNGRKIQS